MENCLKCNNQMGCLKCAEKMEFDEESQSCRCVEGTEVNPEFGVCDRVVYRYVEGSQGSIILTLSVANLVQLIIIIFVLTLYMRLRAEFKRISVNPEGGYNQNDNQE